MLRWRIYYDNGTTFDDSRGEPWDAPGRGIVCIKQVDPTPVMYNVGSQVLREYPFYWYHRQWDAWFGSDLTGLIDQLTNDRQDVVCAVKHGRWTHPASYREIIDKANKDDDFPLKSGSRNIERPIDV